MQPPPGCPYGDGGVGCRGESHGFDGWEGVLMAVLRSWRVGVGLPSAALGVLILLGVGVLDSGVDPMPIARSNATCLS